MPSPFILKHSYADLGDAFSSRAHAKAFAKPALIQSNRDLLAELNPEWDLSSITSDADTWSGQKLIEGSKPVAMVYSGHQFGHFAGRLGDGRALLLGEVMGKDGSLYDIHLKGSGPTEYSRGGDGLSALGPVLREYIVSEAMHALKVPTTRALAACITGEYVYRQEGPVPGAVFARCARSHLRVGSFQYFASEDRYEDLETLFNYTAQRIYPHVLDADKPRVSFLRTVMQRQAELVSKWMSLGFIHGVMNTDNCSLSGETIDFGPCAFMDEFKMDKVFSSIDRYGRYAYCNQPKILLWNLNKLAQCLLGLLKDNESKEDLEEVLFEYEQTYQSHWLKAMSAKLGIEKASDETIALIELYLECLEKEERDYTMSFLDLAEWLEKDTFPESFKAFKSRWQPYIKERKAEALKLMKENNPLVIPRNHLIERVIEKAVRGQFELFYEMIEAVTQPFSEPANKLFKQPPSVEERVEATFCGT